MPGPDDERPVEYIGGPVRRLFMRYPWHVSGVLGVLLITGLRPCTRHVPEPPPVVAPLPAFELFDSLGTSVTGDTLQGDVWIAGFVCVECTGPVGEVGPALATIADKARRHDKPMRFLAIGTDEVRDTPDALAAWTTTRGLSAPHWLSLAGSQTTTDALRLAVVRAFGADRPESWSRVFIIDDRARLRGAYALGDRGTDEVYHRAQHVARESRARRGTP